MTVQMNAPNTAEKVMETSDTDVQRKIRSPKYPKQRNKNALQDSQVFQAESLALS